jgi:hypothetical protein
MSTPFYDLASLVVVPSGYKASKVYAQKPLTTDGQLTFSRASTATRVNASGLIETVSSNVPRLDYTNSTCPKLLLEPSRTNLALYSSAFDNSVWIKEPNNTATSNTVTSPDGSVNADTLSATSGSEINIYQAQTSTSNSTQTFSVFLKKDNLSEIQLYVYSSGFVSRATVNLDNGTITNVVGSGATITSYGNGWYRCSINGVIASGVGFTAGILSITSTGNRNIHAYGGQIEVGAYPTSLIPTTTAAVTRLADACSKTGISSLIGQTEGTLFVEFNHDISVTAALDTRIHLSSGTTANWIFFGFPDGGAKLLRFFINDSSGALSFYSSAPVVQGNNKVAFGYKSGDFVAYLNGVQVATNSTVRSIPVCSQIDLQGGAPNGVAQERANIEQALLFKTRLTNAQLAELTSL